MGIFWDWLRLSRHRPVGLAADDEAAGVFRAALQQFEELMRASVTAGPASRPLPLFYALSQAGRAIVAAQGGSQHEGHGLSIREPADELLESLIRPTERGKRRGQFQVVSATLASPIPTEPIPLGAVLASLPETGHEILETASDRPRPLSVWPTTEPTIPAHGWRTNVLVVFDDKVQTPSDVNRTLLAYPTVKGRLALSEMVVRQVPSVPREWSPRGMGVRMMVKDDTLDEVAPQYRILGRRWIRPALVGESPPPTPLMTWWLLLFALSMLARYQPLQWVRALDVDSSEVSVTLERALRKALDALPQLVSEAIYGISMPVPEITVTGAESPFE